MWNSTQNSRFSNKNFIKYETESNINKDFFKEKVGINP